MQLPMPTDWDGETCCRFAIKWPDSPQWKAILFGLVSSPMQGRLWDFSTGNFLELREDFRPYYDYNFDLKGVIMACDDSNIADALTAIAEAIATSGANPINVTVNAPSSGCGGCDFGDASSTVNVQTFITLGDGTGWNVFGEEPIASVDPGEFPPEYPDLETYDADKCRKANKMADDWIASLDSLGNTTWTTGVIGAGLIIACLVGVITVPPAVIPLLLFALTANEGIAAVLIALENELSENREQVVCILFEGETVEAIISAISDLLDILIAGIPVAGTLGAALKAIALWLVNSDTLNMLFTSEAMENFPDADCSGCEVTGDFVAMTNGGFTCTDLGDDTFQSVFNTGSSRHEIVVAINHDTVDTSSFTNWVGPMMVASYTVLDGSISGITPPPSPIRYFNQSSGALGGGSDPQPATCFAWVIMVANASFTVQFAIDSECP